MAGRVGAKSQAVAIEIRDHLGVESGWLAVQHLVNDHVEVYFLPADSFGRAGGIMLHDAIQVAAVAHGDQKRKGTDIPYITHPFMVAMILSQAGYPEDVIVAGVLHDTLEDTDLTLDDISSRFGKHVADIVEGCSEEDRTLPWKARKQHTIDYLKTASPEVRATSCADKLHNASSMAADYREMGERLWDRFNAGRDEQEWYYRGLVAGLCNRLDEEPASSIFHQFKDTVEELFGSRQVV